MLLPKLKYRDDIKIKYIDAWSGLDLRHKASDGELIWGENLSSEHYPCIAPRVPRVKLGEYQSPDALFSWEGKLLVADRGTLYYDGSPLGNVSEGDKQFAVVNTKLIIWPDKLYVDLSGDSATLGRLDDYVETHGTVTFASNTLQTTLYPTMQSGLKLPEYSGDIADFKPGIYTYGQDRTAIDWDKNTGWALPTAEKTSIFQLDNSYGIDRIAIGDIFIPQTVEHTYPSGKVSTSSYFVDCDNITAAAPAIDTGDYNGGGYYGVISKVDIETGAPGYTSRAQIWCDICHVDYSNKLFSTVFKVGDVVDITGATVSEMEVSSGNWFEDLLNPPTSVEINNNGSKLTISAIDDSTNTLTFEGEPFTAGTDTAAIRIQRNVPDLDYICALDNRLWGVSNRDRTIYASALGDPTNFWDYSGISTDSYAVAVGSDGDFTACVPYGDQILCFKEGLVHRIAGNCPNYYMYTDYIPGVQKGCHKSALTINNALYYRSPEGIYAYTGGSPRLISYPIDSVAWTGAVAGAAGNLYYVCFEKVDGFELFVYDILKDMWLREDSSEVLDFSYVDGIIYMALPDGVYRYDGTGNETVEWEAVLAPFHEDSFYKKQYKRLRIDLSLDEGATVAIYVSADGKPPMRMMWTSRQGRHRLGGAIPPMRCDNLTVKITGRGKGIVHALEYEYTFCGKEGNI